MKTNNTIEISIECNTINTKPLVITPHKIKFAYDKHTKGKSVALFVSDGEQNDYSHYISIPTPELKKILEFLIDAEK